MLHSRHASNDGTLGWCQLFEVIGGYANSRSLPSSSGVETLDIVSSEQRNQFEFHGYRARNLPQWGPRRVHYKCSVIFSIVGKYTQRQLATVKGRKARTGCMKHGSLVFGRLPRLCYHPFRGCNSVLRLYCPQTLNAFPSQSPWATTRPLHYVV